MELTKIGFDFHENHKTLELVDVTGASFFEKWSKIGNFESDTLRYFDKAVKKIIDCLPNVVVKNHSINEQVGKYSAAYFEFYEFKSMDSGDLVVSIFINRDGTSGGDTRIFATEEGKKLLECIDLETW